ncbi:hypothetical protein [Pseudomonas fluorescens]|uniref:hypothetical protein n=1 Tax=Pseudomonas fluorescens TaxID=294 RepID=UPI001A9FCBDF|nr:hypothetical protein [Pseudomonas fluorescens]QTD30809.1 hypothetical protein JZM58_15980 [Pseudomonas fluorescens]
MTQKNLILNGDFGTGDFQHWIARNYDTPMSVVLHNSNYAVRMVGGRNQGQNLATERFRTEPGEFTLSFDVQAPDAVPLQDTKDRRFHISDHDKLSNPLLHAFVIYTLWLENPTTGESEVWHQLKYVDPTKQTLTFKGTVPPGFERVDIYLAIPSDPFGNKGHYIIDNFWFWVL